MKSILRYALRALLVLIVLVAGLAVWKREEITRLLVVNSLFDAEKIVANFTQMDQAFLTAELPRGAAPVTPLPMGELLVLPSHIEDWRKDRRATSLLVLHKGKIRHEAYYEGTSAEDRRISWSMAKSYLATLMGVMLEQGLIDSLDDPVTKYAPALSDSGYATATIRNVLNMASGVEFNEDYLDYNSDINRMGRELALGGTLDQFTIDQKKTSATPGEIWSYVSIDTHVIGMVIRGAAGRSIPDLMSEFVIAPLGLEQDGYYVTDGEGAAFVLGGLNFTTRDYARFGLMTEQGGEIEGRRVVSSDWITAATTPSAPKDGGFGYGYQWWTAEDHRPGEFLAIGVYGQNIYVDQTRDLVIVLTSADRNFRKSGRYEENIDVFREIGSML